ncbi:MAG: hypothetical protein HGA87_01325 [Desulfobulbaceae bacterium]|nr:hypothetical protein [Desulfobulbaceae bacterium]
MMKMLSVWISGIAVGISLCTMVLSCSKANGATYGNDVAALGIVSATSSAAGTADTTKVEVRK